MPDLRYRLAACLLLAICGIRPGMAAEPSPRAAGVVAVNAKVSARNLALNQPVRLEFYTGARQIENVDIAAAVAAGVELNGARAWRLLGRPVVVEDAKIRTVQVVVGLAARQAGDLALPRIPLTWLGGDAFGEFGAVHVDDSLVVGGETRPLPAELAGVAGHPWGSSLEDLRARLPQMAVEERGDLTVATPAPGLELGFRQGILAEAQVDAAGIELAQALPSFIQRWGLPEGGEGADPVWVLGWTRIAAGAHPGGVRLRLRREDIVASAAGAKVQGRIFSLLEGGR